MKDEGCQESLVTRHNAQATSPSRGPSQIFLDPPVPLQEIGHEQLGKVRLVVNGGDHGRFGNSRDHAFFHRGGRRDAEGVPIQAPFAKKAAGSKDCDDRFLALLGDDGELELAFLEIKDRIRDIAL